MDVFLSPSEFNLHHVLQVENDFILPLEKEVFIEQLKDIVDKAEDMLSEDTEGEKNSEQAGGPKQTEAPGTLGTEVRTKLCTVNSYSIFSLGCACLENIITAALWTHCTAALWTHWSALPTEVDDNSIISDTIISCLFFFCYLCSAAL